MTALAFRLLFADGRRAVAMFLVMLLTTALASTILLLVLSVKPAMQARADRAAWEFGSVTEQLASSQSAPSYTAVYSSPLYCTCGQITRVYLAPHGPQAPLFPGLDRQPRSGEVFVSPALGDLIQSSPQLSRRYGISAELIQKTVLPGPDSLMTVQYLPRTQMPPIETRLVTKFGLSSDQLSRNYAPGTLEVLIAIGGVALIAPILLLLSTITRLSATSREQRLAALRLCGATRYQISWITTVESGLVGVTGALLGVVSFFLARPLATHITIDERWFINDLTPPPSSYALVLMGVPLLATAAALTTLHRAAVSPLGAVRRSQPHHLSIWRLTPLLLGSAAAMVLVASGKAGSLGGTRLAAGASAFLIVNLLALGPWLTRLLGRCMTTFGGLGLLVGRRIDDDPRAAFRGIAGIILAVFVTTILAATTPAATASSSDNDNRTGLTEKAAAADLKMVTPGAALNMIEKLRKVNGISSALLIYEGTTSQGDPIWIADCRLLQPLMKIKTSDCGRTGVLTTQAARAAIHDQTLKIPQLRTIDLDLDLDPVTLTVTGLRNIGVFQAAHAYDTPAVIVSPDQFSRNELAQVRPNKLLIGYQTPQALETARTIVDHHAPGAEFANRAEVIEQNTMGARHLHQAAALTALASFVIAGLSLTSSALIGLLERRRHYILLRKTGTSLRQLRQAMFLETTAPILAASTTVTLIGLAISMTVLTANNLNLPVLWTLTWPLAAGIGMALLISSSTLPALGALTDPCNQAFDSPVVTPVPVGKSGVVAVR